MIENQNNPTFETIPASEQKQLKCWYATEVYRINMDKTLGGGMTGADVGIPIGNFPG